MKITDTHVYFYSPREVFSNWHKCEFKDPITGLLFGSSEQAFFWYKADFFKDNKRRFLIENEKNPKTAKDWGREIINYDEKSWKSMRVGYMTYVNYLKYSQNPEFTRELLETENRKLVEASPFDKIWGVGLKETDIKILDEKEWLGTNLLGIALENVRELIK